MDVDFIENESYFLQPQVHVQGETNSGGDPEPGFTQCWIPNSNSGPENSSQEAAEIGGPKNVLLEEITGQEAAENSGHEAAGPENVFSSPNQTTHSGLNDDVQLNESNPNSEINWARPGNADTETLTQEIETGPNSWFESEEVIQSDSQPHDPSSPKVSSLNQYSQFKLPTRINRGVPPNWYIPEDGTSRRVKYPITNYTTTKHLSNQLKIFVLQASSIHVPDRVEEAVQDKRWVEAMRVEMDALEKNHTWKLVDLPEGKKTVGCKWVYSIKYNAEGKIERYKARLVAKGYTQTYEIDFQETFLPVAKLNTVRVLLSLAVNFDWPLHQFDVKNAFLHGDLKEEIYMDVPPGYQYSGSDKKVCKLERSLYGLKQSPRAWFGRFSSAMKRYGYHQSNSDHTLFYKSDQGKIAILIIYVDDMIITGDNLEEIQKLEEGLAREFEMKNLGGLKYFLGIEVARNQNSICLSQRKYVLDLLAEVGMLECKPVDTPIVQNQKFGNSQNQVPANKERYQRLVGKLIYLSHTRPDIAYAVSIVSQFMHLPSEEHMEAVLRILRYLKGAPGRGLMFRKNRHLDVIGYTDADWAGSVDDRKSTTGYFTFVGSNLVT